MNRNLPLSIFTTVFSLTFGSCDFTELQQGTSSISVVSDADKQTMAIKLYDKKYTPSLFILKFVRQRTYDLSYIDSNNFRVSYSDSLGNLPIFWRFGLNNGYLNYYGFSFESCEASRNCFDKFYRIADSIVSTFSSKYGFPSQNIRIERNLYPGEQFPIQGVIQEAIWDVDSQQIKMSFSASGEHNMYGYSLDVSRSK